METLEDLNAKLYEAKLARHRLLTGYQEVSVNLQGLGSATYTQANIESLEKYILELKQKIAKRQSKSRRTIIRTSF